MPLLKSLEIAFRSFLIWSLRLVVRRSRASHATVDINRSSILFIRQDRIGDVLVSTPIFRAVKSRYPNATLDVLLSPNNFMALSNNPHIGTRWIYQKRPLHDVKLLMKIRRQKYDFVIDLMDNPSATSTVITLLSGARWTIGLEKDNAYSYDVVVPLLSRRDVHIVDRIAQLLAVFNIEPDSAKEGIEYHTAPESDANVDRYIKVHSQPGHKLIGVNISAGNEIRFWGIDRYRNLLSEIRSGEENCSFYIFSKESDRERALAIASDIPGATTPETRSFDEFAAFIKRMNYLVTPDTSAVHLAAAFRIPAVVLYVQSDKNLRIWDPYRSPAECVVTDRDDLSTISVGQVFDAFRRLRLTTSGRG